jgi:hypothetical protein
VACGLWLVACGWWLAEVLPSFSFPCSPQNQRMEHETRYKNKKKKKKEKKQSQSENGKPERVGSGKCRYLVFQGDGKARDQPNALYALLCI